MKDRGELIPIPASITAGGAGFRLVDTTQIVARPASPDVVWIAEHLAGILRRSTGFDLPAVGAGFAGWRDAICLTLGDRSTLGSEGYELDVSPDSVQIRAADPAGLFWGTQTLRQLLPPAIELPEAQPGPWTVPGFRIADRPRFSWRGTALDVARHFLPVDDVKRHIDLAALYKINVLHLHLTDDQGWRIAINSWPRLATHGGSTQVGGGPGGYYNQADYREIVRYAQDRHVTVIPEIDVPGHTNAALASYAELSCDARAPALYTGIEVGFSSLCVDKEETYRFLDDVIGEVADLTPGPHIHIGGDEVRTLSVKEYASFIERAQRIVQSHGKITIGWQEVARARLEAGTIVQYWDTKSDPTPIRRAALSGARLVLSPASHAYLDMKYTPATPLGLEWAGHVEVEDAYDWDPATLLDGVGDQHVLGVEAQLFGESVRSIADVQYLSLPRLPGVAEIAWSPRAERSWVGYTPRLAAHGPRWSAMGINFYRSPQVPWRA